MTGGQRHTCGFVMGPDAPYTFLAHTLCCCPNAPSHDPQWGGELGRAYSLGPSRHGIVAWAWYLRVSS